MRDFKKLKAKYDSQLEHFDNEVAKKEEKIVIANNWMHILILKMKLFFYLKFVPKIIYFKNFWYVQKAKRIQKHTLRMSGDVWYRNIIPTTFNWLVLLIMLVVMIFPFYWMLITSFKSYSEVDPSVSRSLWDLLWPESWSLNTYKEMFRFVNSVSSSNIGFSRFFVNSFLISTISTITQLIVSILGGFAIYNWRTKINPIFMGIMFSIMMVPGEAMLLGRYIMMVELNWKNSLLALIVPFIGNVFTIYLMSNAFYSLNKDLKRAAKIDGLSSFSYFLKIALPAITATIITSFIIAFIDSWNSVLWPVTIMSDDSEWKTIPLMLWKIMQASGMEPELQVGFTPTNLKMAASLIAILPMIIVFVVFNRIIINGLSRRSSSGSKG